MSNFHRDKPKKRLAGPAQAVSQILPIVGKNLNLDKKVQEWCLLSLWQQVVDTPFQGKTRAVSIKSKGPKNHLVVMATSASVAQELSFSLEKYQEKLNTYAPQTGIRIHRIEIRVG